MSQYEFETSKLVIIAEGGREVFFGWLSQGWENIKIEAANTGKREGSFGVYKWKII